MPRPYELGRRAGPKADTRSRIVAAALQLIRDHGLAGASNLAIARAADVAPATVRNHFPERADLSDAVFTALLAEVRVPTPAIFDGLESLDERVQRLAVELATFYERGEGWWRVYEREPELISAWGGGIDGYYAQVERLMRACLLELGTDERSLAVVAAVIGPPTFFALRARGMSSDEAVRMCVDLALPWLERRRTELANTA